MGGKKGNKSSDLGRSIIKDRFGKKNRSGNSLLHTSELNDGQDWNRIDFNSITEQTHVDEFLSTAELAGREFQAEKLNINFVRPTLMAGMLSEAEKKVVLEAQEQNKKFLRIPRRPPWDANTTIEQLLEAERSSFLEWRKSLVDLEDIDGITMTPYERNLEFWRQLWRVIERSDVVVQIVDARNPLLFRCEDLENYVKEVDAKKENLILVNKSDFLTESQREAWAQYFRDRSIKAVFFSALSGEELDIIREEEERCLLEEEERRLQKETECKENIDKESVEEVAVDVNVEECAKDLESLSVQRKKDGVCQAESVESCSSTDSNTDFVTSSRLLSRSELIEVFATLYKKEKILGKCVTIGLVGYPNVGKSSTINCLMQDKKVSVSATPGKTKHFQTLFLRNDILLCDCPGLVFPAFVATKPEMIISGILPIDQMRDEVPPINLVASHIPRRVFENTYGINLPAPLEGEDPRRPPTSEELLNSYGFMRGFMTPRGLPDNPRTARYILKDYVNGKLLYCHAPPNASQSEYHIHTLKKLSKPKADVKPTPQQRATQPYQIRPDALDMRFFGVSKVSHVHVKGINRGGPPVLSMKSRSAGPDGQPRQKNFKKKEKLRRRYAHLDD